MGRMPRWSAILLACAAVAAHASAQEAARAPGTLLLRVVDSAGRQPVPNAEVTSGGRRGLTDGRGEMRILWPSAGTLHVRVRQLGFRYVERDVRRDAARSAEDTLLVPLARLQFALPQVVVRATQKCDASRGRDEALSEASMELLRFGAEQFENFRRAYPFTLVLWRRTTSDIPRVRPEEGADTIPSAQWGDGYEPGRVVQQREANSYFVPLLFVSALADSAFWDRHCFAARGVETMNGRRLIRLDFTPARGVRETEWEGSAWLDSARSVLTRVRFSLTNLRRFEGPLRFEGYTVFSSPSPYIALPDTTIAWWTTEVPGGPYGESRQMPARQSYVIREVTYSGKEPPKER